jgi:hypothetical protein
LLSLISREGEVIFRTFSNVDYFSLDESSQSGENMNKYDTMRMMSSSSYTASTVPVVEPNENDVLLGRGGKNNQWSGNERLREMAREMSAAYSAAKKRNKPQLAMDLVNKVRALTPMGRYVYVYVFDIPMEHTVRRLMLLANFFNG